MLLKEKEEIVGSNYLICNYSNVDFKTFELLNEKLDRLGYGCVVVKSNSLEMNEKIFTGSLLIIYSLNKNFFENYEALNNLLEKLNYILVLSFVDQKSLYLEGYIKKITKRKEKEEIIISYVYHQLLLYIKMLLLQIKLLILILNKKDGKY